MKWTAWGPGPDNLSIAVVMEEDGGIIRILGFYVFDGTRCLPGSHATWTAAWDAGVEYLDDLSRSRDATAEEAEDSAPSQKP